MSPVVPVVSRTGRNDEPGQVLALVNRERASRGLHPLKANVRLARAAHYRAADMAARDYFSHAGFGAAIKRFRYRWRSVGENIAKGQSSAGEVHGDWMDSPPHRANVLDERFRELGVARVEDIWCELFGTRR